MSCRGDEERSDIIHLCSPSWFDLLHSPPCRIKGFALTLGSTRRDFLKLGSMFSATSQNSLSMKQWELHKQGTNTQEQECSVSLMLWHHTGWTVPAEMELHELISPLHTLMVWLYLFKVVFTSLFPICISHIYFVHMETGAGVLPSIGTVITLWTKSFPYLFMTFQHMSFI